MTGTGGMNQTARCEFLQPRTFLVGAAEYPQDSDYVLARAAARGAVAALGDLYERHNRRVYAVCLRMTGNAADAEDLTQEVFIHLFRKIGSFRGESQFTTWLHRLTVNYVLMYFRRAAARKEEMPEDIEAAILTSRRRRNSAGAQAVDRIALDRALAQLPSGCRAVFVLFDIEGYKHGEIASLLGCTVGNSKSQLHKARLKLWRLLQFGSLK